MLRDDVCLYDRSFTFCEVRWGLKCGNSEALGSCGVTVHKSINAYLSLSNTCESVILSSSRICSDGWLKLCL